MRLPDRSASNAKDELFPSRSLLRMELVAKAIDICKSRGISFTAGEVVSEAEALEHYIEGAKA